MDGGKDAAMILKIIGACMVIAGCGSVGFKIAANHRKEERHLRQLSNVLDYMECELQYRLTPLPQLCRQAAAEFPAMSVFSKLVLVMEAQTHVDADQCMSEALRSCKNVPPITRNILELLGKSIGRFDLDGQLKGFASARQECKRNLDLLSVNLDNRLRSYQTLGLCAGAALAILFV